MKISGGTQNDKTAKQCPEVKEYEILEHAADLKIRTRGRDLKEAFSNFLKGIFEFCRPEFEDQKPTVREIWLKAENLESLLIDFLSQILYLSDVNDEVYSAIDFEILTPRELKGKIIGRKIARQQAEIKAATWHELEIKKRDDYWEATVLFDI